MRTFLEKKSTVVLSAIGVGVCSLAIMAALTETDPQFDTGLYNEIMLYQVDSLDTLAERFEDTRHWLPPFPPTDQMFYQDMSPVLVPLDLDAGLFPKQFIRKLIPEKTEEGYVKYPLFIMEDPQTRERVFYNSNIKQIGSVPAPADYDAREYVDSIYGDPPTNLTMEEMDVWYQERDPSRIGVYCELVTEEAVIAHVAAQSATPDGMSLPGPIVMSYSGGETFTNIKIVAMEVVSNGMELSVGYPNDYTNRLEFFACTDLLTQEWSSLHVANVSSTTNYIDWTDTDFEDHDIRFYYVWNADYDGDSDGLSDGRENLVYDTDPDDSDSDDDGISDGDEVDGRTDPNNDDTNGPTVSITAPVGNSEWIWIP